MGHNGGGELREVTESLGLVATVAAVQAAVESQLAQQGAREVAEGMVEMGGSEAAAMVMARVAAVTREVAETEAVDLAVVTTGAEMARREMAAEATAAAVYWRWWQWWGAASVEAAMVAGGPPRWRRRRWHGTQWRR